MAYFYIYFIKSTISAPAEARGALVTRVELAGDAGGGSEGVIRSAPKSPARALRAKGSRAGSPVSESRRPLLRA